MGSIIQLHVDNDIYSRKERVLQWLITGFYVSLFLPDMPVVSNLLIAGVVIHSLFYNSWKEKLSLLRERKAVLLMLLFFVFQLISAGLSGNRAEGFTMLAMRAPLVVFPLSIGLLYIRERLKYRLVLSYSIVMTAVAITCLLYGIRHYRTTGDSQWLYNDSLTKIIGRQSSYVAIMVNVAVAGYAFLLKNDFFAAGQKKWIWGSIGILLTFHFLLASRIAIILLYSALLVYVVWRTSKKGGYVPVLSTVIGLLLLAGLFRLGFPKTFNRFRELQYTAYRYDSEAPESHYNMQVSADQWNGANIRLAVWHCGITLSGRHWLTGIPLGDKQDSLMEEYKRRGFAFAYHSKRNLHNTYLDVLVNTGSIGLAVFIFGYLLFPLAAAVRVKDGLGILIILTLGISLVTETWIDRSLGCMLLGFFSSLVAAWKKIGSSGPVILKI